MKLKTMKEVSIKDYDGGITEEDIKKLLKQEAIKYLKSMNSEIEQIKRNPEAYRDWKQAGSPYIQNQEIIRWIKMFFNISEEEKSMRSST